MRVFVFMILSVFLAFPTFAKEGDPADLANRAKFAAACKDMISHGGPCARVKMGNDGRRRCVDQHISDPRVTPECRASLDEWRALPQDEELK